VRTIFGKISFTKSSVISSYVCHQCRMNTSSHMLFISHPLNIRLYASSSSEQNTRDQHLLVLDRLARATVAVVGIGGVGSWAAEALCRSGVGNIILIDLDDICISNTNRQVHAVSTSVGKRKIDEMKTRLLHINPHCNITTILDFVSTENVDGIIESIAPELAVCLDAIDGKIEKAALIAACATRQVPIVTVGGSAGKMDPTKIIFDDLARAKEDRLLFACRKILRQEYGFKKANLRNPTRPAKKWNIIAVHSTERIKYVPDDEVNNGSSFRICDSSLGTACHVTGTFGFVAASRIVDMIAKDNLMKPTAM